MNAHSLVIGLFCGLIVASTARAARPDGFALNSAQLGACREEGLERFKDQRGIYRSGGAARLKRASTRFSVLREDRVYRIVGDRALSLTIYRPSGANSNHRFPALLQIHGGGWVGGERAQLDDFSEKLAGMGMIVVSIDYRVAPQDLFPAAPIDVQAAATWIAVHGNSLGVERSAGLSVFGFSAGANLAGYLAMSSGPSSSAGLPVTRAILMSGRADLTIRDLGTDYSSIYLGGSIKDVPSRYRAASPIYKIPEGQSPSSIPEVLFVHQTTDNVIPWQQSCRFEKALEAHSAKPLLLLLPEHRPAHGPAGENRALALQAMAHFLGLI